MIKLIPLLKVYRPLLILVPAIIFGLGFYFSEASFSWPAFLQVLCLTFLAPLLVFGLNDVFDYETDSTNPRKLNRFFGGLAEKKNHVLIVSAALIVSFALILSSIFTLNFLNIFGMLLAIGVAWGYSVPQIHLKSKVFGDIFSNILGLGSIAVLGASFGSFDVLLQNVPFQRIIGIILALVMASLLAGLADFEADRKAGLTTTAIFLGKKWTTILGLLAILPLTLIRFDEATFLRYSILLIILVYLPLLWLYENKRVVSFVYALIAVITVLSFGFYGLNLLWL